MKKKVVIVKHRKGFFLAVNGDLMKREVTQNGGFHKDMNTIAKYLKKVQHTYQNYEFDPLAYVTSYDLTDDSEFIDIDRIWDPSTHKINIDTGEIIEYQKPEKFMLEPDNTVEEEILENKSPIEKSESHVRGWETRKQNIARQLAEKEREDLLKRIKARRDKLKAEVIKQHNEANKQVEEVAPEQQATQTFYKSVNSKKMKTNAENKSEQTMNVEQPKANGRIRKIRRGGAEALNGIIQTVGDTGVTGLMIGSDFLEGCAHLWAWGTASAVKPLGLHPDMTRRELKDSIIKRNDKRVELIEGIVLNPVSTIKAL